ncbi:ABC transporter substrate-binding protein [Methanolobus sp. ZRKC3]|uniref:ABC transporter substrate-binding protein n=1 Tax=Methanolobus sp. ZRKC3 TaxID=3125786 RepID=UPI00324F660F
MNEKWKLLGVAVFFILIIFAVSASMSQNAENAGDEITFAHQDRIADAALIVAFEQGFFEEEGVNVKPMRFSSGPSCAEALLYGNADFGTMGDTTAIITVVQGHPVKIIASHGGGEDRHRIIVSEKSGINSIAELEGKRIGVKLGTSTHGGMLLFAKENGLELTDEIIDLRPSEQLTALAAGELDAIVASEPTPSLAEAGGYGHELATLGGLDNTYPILTLVNKQFAEENPEKVVSVLRAMQKATDYIHENPEEVVSIQAELTGLDGEVIENAMEYHYYELDMSDKTTDSLKVSAEFLMNVGKIKNMPDFSTVTEPTYLDDLEQVIHD